MFGNLSKRKRGLLRRFDALNRRGESEPNARELNKERPLVWIQLEEVLAQEEVMWLQRSRCNWYRDGDRNTKYFHSVVNSRKKQNRIEALRTKDGE